MNTPKLTDAVIEKLAVKYEDFGFGQVDGHGVTTHGFDSDGLVKFVRAIEAAAQAPLLARIAELERDLQFVERWANHHGAKTHTTAEEALSVIQHYPGITAITNGYADGKVPDTPNPFARIAEQAQQLLSAQAQAQENHERAERAEQRCADLYADVQRFKEHALNEKGARVSLEVELAAAKVDAERYRWLRDFNPTRYAVDLGADLVNINSKEDGQRELDAAIDAMRKGEQP